MEIAEHLKISPVNQNSMHIEHVGKQNHTDKKKNFCQSFLCGKINKLLGVCYKTRKSKRVI